MKKTTQARPSSRGHCASRTVFLSILWSLVFIEGRRVAWDSPCVFKRSSVVLLMLACVANTQAHASDKPVVVAGYATAKPLVGTLLPKSGLTAEDFIGVALPVSAYTNYSAVVWSDIIKDPEALGDESFWDLGENPIELAEYVQSGGVLVVAGVGIPVSNFKMVRKLGSNLADILGISGVALSRPQGPVRIIEPSDPLFAGLPTERASYSWVGETSGAAAGPTTGRVLAVVSTESGEELPFITVHEMGKGRVYWMGTAPARVPKVVGSEEDRAAYERVLLNALRAPNP